VTSAGRALGDVADTLGLTEEEEIEDGRDVGEERGKKSKWQIENKRVIIPNNKI
jgi:hypothetical protein